MSKRKPHTIQRALVDIVIPTRGKFDFLSRCLDSIPEAVGDITHSIRIIDNGSKREEATAFYSKYRPDNKFSISIYPSGLGYPKACNMGVKQGNAPLIMILTSDVFLQPHAIEHLVMEMDDPKVGIVAPTLLFAENTPNGPGGKVQHVGLEMNIRAEIFHQFIAWSPDNPKVLSKKEAFAVTGAAFMTRRNLWTKIGGYFEGYGLGTYEDCEYSIRVRKLGYNIRISHESVGSHWVNAAASEAGVAYPLNENRHIFMSRNTKDIMWTEWMYY